MSAAVVRVHAGRHHRAHTPIRFELPPALQVADGHFALRARHGATIPLQVVRSEGGLVAYAVVPQLSAGQEEELEIERAEPSDYTRGVAIRERDGGEGLDVLQDGVLQASYHVAGPGGARLARPYWFPLTGPGGVRVTRAHPMEPDVAGETRDHPHHRSMWVAYGEVNEVDNWSEQRDHGLTIHERFEGVVSGPVVGGYTALARWTDHEGAPLLRERRTARFYRQPDACRAIDVTLELAAHDAPVTFGDTKEGGLIAVRVATSMDGKAGGTIRNSYGGVGEAETWGKRAEWCDYSGDVDGRTVGVAIYDHPSNFRAPTYWHVRDYGLMATNVFGGEAFTGNPGLNGRYTLKAGSSLTFRYRLVVHAGTADDAAVAERYHDFINPPTITVA